MNPTETQISQAATAIANARGGRRGVPEISNILEILPPKLRQEVREDASAALQAVSIPEDLERTRLKEEHTRFRAVCERLIEQWDEDGCVWIGCIEDARAAINFANEETQTHKEGTTHP